MEAQAAQLEEAVAIFQLAKGESRPAAPGGTVAALSYTATASSEVALPTRRPSPCLAPELGAA
ncbi:hypothetical protein [Billgrantia antri]|uniref:hypothetical protein n=1 Tax=Billgrantia antri TaxID=2846777 RepID=UPI003B225419